MSRSYISAGLRREVIQRAGACCEYCLTNMDDRPIDFAVDYVIAEKHGGPTHTTNLCLSCYWCNSYKGSDISSVDWDADESIVPLFNPRQQEWNDHFQLRGAEIIPQTAHCRVTVFLLQLNASERIKERQLLMQLGVYPCRKAENR